MAELTKGTGVTVNSVLPSATRSDGIIDYLRQTAPEPGMTDQQIEAHFFQTYRPSSLIARMIEADEIAAINVMSGVRLSRHYFPRMLARNWGRVILCQAKLALSLRQTWCITASVNQLNSPYREEWQS